jgi:hypothetical protein
MNRQPHNGKLNSLTEAHLRVNFLFLWDLAQAFSLPIPTLDALKTERAAKSAALP